MAVKLTMKMSPTEAGKLYMKACEMEKKLKEARAAMQAAKEAQGWDSMPVEIHRHIDDLFRAIAH